MMDFEKTLQILVDADVDFVVVGGVAASLHGSARFTTDIDIAYSRDSQNARRLASALQPFHPRPRGFPEGVPFVWDEITIANNTVLTLDTDLGPIDLPAEVAGIGSYDQIKANATPVTGRGPSLRVLDLPALIAAKTAAGRSKDLEALSELESLLEARDDSEP